MRLLMDWLSYVQDVLYLSIHSWMRSCPEKPIAINCVMLQTSSSSHWSKLVGTVVVKMTDCAFPSVQDIWGILYINVKRQPNGRENYPSLNELEQSDECLWKLIECTGSEEMKSTALTFFKQRRWMISRDSNVSTHMDYTEFFLSKLNMLLSISLDRKRKGLRRLLTRFIGIYSQTAQVTTFVKWSNVAILCGLSHSIVLGWKPLSIWSRTVLSDAEGNEKNTELYRILVSDRK